MQKHQLAWRYLKQRCLTKLMSGRACMMLAMAVLFFGGLGSSLFGVFAQSAFAQSACSRGDTAYTVVSGDTLSTIANRYHTSWQNLAQHNKITDAKLIYIDESVCIPNGKGHANVATGSGNAYPYGQCTWWADQRFHKLKGAYVPWSGDAWQWTARARAYHWRVSSRPSVGAIVNLQPYVQGAYGLGHVAVVEKILKNGHVIASNMNWGGSSRVVNVEFAPGAGVTFITR
jgi:LysM repeat protein